MCRALSTGTGARLAARILHMRAQCDNLWAVITLNGCCLEQVSRPRAQCLCSDCEIEHQGRLAVNEELGVMPCQGLHCPKQGLWRPYSRL